MKKLIFMLMLLSLGFAETPSEALQKLIELWEKKQFSKYVTTRVDVSKVPDPKIFKAYPNLLRNMNKRHPGFAKNKIAVYQEALAIKPRFSKDSTEVLYEVKSGQVSLIKVNTKWMEVVQ